MVIYKYMIEIIHTIIRNITFLLVIAPLFNYCNTWLEYKSRCKNNHFYTFRIIT